jgi:apolipoprotein D and lipocalin family protein
MNSRDNQVWERRKAMRNIANTDYAPADPLYAGNHVFQKPSARSDGMNRALAVNAFLIAGLAITAVGVMMANAQPALHTVPRVDLRHYAGKWYEIARYPNRFERNCDRDVTAEYSLREDGDIRVVNACTTPTGKIKRIEGTARVADPATNAKLRVRFFWPFSGNYWILDLGANYEYAVVGEPGRDYLWILSRTPQLPDALYEQITRRLAANGYDPKRLKKTPQSFAAKT